MTPAVRPVIPPLDKFGRCSCPGHPCVSHPAVHTTSVGLSKDRAADDVGEWVLPEPSSRGVDQEARGMTEGRTQITRPSEKQRVAELRARRVAEARARAGLCPRDDWARTHGLVDSLDRHWPDEAHAR